MAPRDLTTPPCASCRARALALGLCCAALLASGCRGNLSEDPPVHLNPNMDNVARYDPQEGSPLFKDGRAMRPEVPGTVARGELATDERMFRGTKDGKPVTELPVKLSKAMLQRGRKRYDIYCAVCHGQAGMADGVVVKRGMLPPPSFHDDRIRVMPVGQMYHVISNGVRNMPSYRAQIPVDDRWAIVSYVRALQVSRSAKLRDVPADIATQKGWSTK